MTRPVKKATSFKDHGNPRSWKLVFLGLAMFFNLSAWIQVYGQVTDPIFGRKETFGIGPRAIGMGSAFTALADDASAVYWNPAGLSQLSSYELEVSASPVNFDSRFGFPYYSSIQFIMPIAKENTLGISFFRPFRDSFSP